MWLELFIWALINLHPDKVRRRAMTFLGLSLLILLPLFIINLQMTHRGFRPTLPGLTIEAGDPAELEGQHQLEDDSL